jgi:DNA-binding NarL/FixJ family response regulator
VNSPKNPTAMKGMTSALIIDDHPLFCEALSMTLQTFIGIARIETAGLLEFALERLESAALPATLPDVIVLDLNLPDVNGMDGLVRLRRAAGSIPVVVVSSMAEARIVGAAIRAGAAGFVPKHSQREVFRSAFAAVARGERYVPEGYDISAPECDLGTPREEATSRLRLLTRQQAKILQLICEGKMNKQIAYDLSIAETTVKAHITAIMRKLGVYSRTQAVLLARDMDFSGHLPDA